MVISSTSEVPTAGGHLTITGTAFLSPLRVYLNEEEVEVISHTATNIVSAAKAGTGKDHSIRIVSGVDICTKSINSSWSYHYLTFIPFVILTIIAMRHQL